MNDKQERKQTRGEYLVGASFNPSNDPMVDDIKRRAAELIDIIDTLAAMVENGAAPWEAGRCASRAVEAIEAGAMWAVKAATKPPRA